MIRVGVCLVVLLCSTVARAQGVGFVGGASVDPEQLYVGAFFETPPLAQNVRVRPGVDGGWGDGLRIATINLDVMYGVDVTSGWRFYSGGGPVVLIIRADESSDAAGTRTVDDVTGGLEGLLGFAHPGGFFVEFKFVHARNGPALKFGAGFKIG